MLPPIVAHGAVLVRRIIAHSDVLASSVSASKRQNGLAEDVRRTHYSKLYNLNENPNSPNASLPHDTPMGL